MDAVHDGATLQILYEGKTADTALNEKHEFDTKFEDLFRDRSEADLLAIKKKYGAAGDILEAEQRIAAIARDMVNHYIDNILPNGFKAQVVCHSKLAAIRYRSAIEAALTERLERERLKAAPNQELIKQIAFLKAVVVISSDGTNEAAYVTQARKQAKAWNAVENFCRPFDRDDASKELTGKPVARDVARQLRRYLPSSNQRRLWIHPILMQSRSVRRSNDHPFREQNRIHPFGREFLGPRKYPQGGRSESSRCLGEKTFRHAITHQHSSVAILGVASPAYRRR